MQVFHHLWSWEIKKVGTTGWWTLLIQSNSTHSLWNRRQTCNNVSKPCNTDMEQQACPCEMHNNGSLKNKLKLSITKQGVWANQIQLYTATSYYQLLVYIYFPHPLNNNYQWLICEPQQHAHLCYGEYYLLHGTRSYQEKLFRLHAQIKHSTSNFSSSTRPYFPRCKS